MKLRGTQWGVFSYVPAMPQQSTLRDRFPASSNYGIGGTVNIKALASCPKELLKQ